MKHFYLILIFCFGKLFCQSYHEETWQYLLKNNRQESAVYANKLTDETIGDFITKRIIAAENGRLNTDKDFVKGLTSYKNFQYYLYAFWNESYIFSDYVESGFNKGHRDITEILLNSEIENPTIKNAIYYLKAIIEREKKNVASYYDNLSKIKALNQWQFCGVFENLNQSGLDIVYPPEEFALSREDFDANSNGKINWYIPEGYERESYQFLTNHSEYGAGVHYGQKFIDNSQPREVYLRIGNSGTFKVFLNDVMIVENREIRTTDLDSYNVKVLLPKGVSRLLVKNASGGELSYFIVRITDESGNAIEDLKYYNSYRSYHKSTHSSLNPIEVKNSIETYFLNLVESEPDNILYKIALVNTYFRNQNFTPAKEILVDLIEQYPKSSYLKRHLIEAYKMEGDDTSMSKLEEYIKLNDENYFFSVISSFQETNKINELDLKSLKSYVDKISKATDMKIISIAADLMYNNRLGDKKVLRENIDSLMSQTKNWPLMQSVFVNFYEVALGDDKKTLEILEDINDRYVNSSAVNLLSSTYENQNKSEKVIELQKSLFELFSYDNTITLELVRKLMKYEKYDKALEYVNKALENYPYSFTAMKLKAEILVQLREKEKAIAYYKKVLLYNNGDSDVRKRLQDLAGKEDLVETYHRKDVYNYIDENRDKINKNNYGYNLLLDEITTQLYNEGGGKSKATYIFEITSEEGVERFKEYNLNLSGSYQILKGEIVKKNKSVIKADRKGSNFVFKGLEPGDVIYVEYLFYFTSSGRFFKDYVDYFRFDTYHPSLKSSYTLLIPKTTGLNYTVTNGEVEFSKQELKDHYKYQWTLNNIPAISPMENYMPNIVDISRYLHISTISSWNDIAYWYSDLVRFQKESNSMVDKAFHEIFPKGIRGISNLKKAEMIYNYISKNINYSSVSFRQSGFVPQKPSKTLITKLGDCKDLSTLFVVLVEKALLETNLVLILTNDHGQKSIVLPSQDFNHCIVKIEDEGRGMFIELTDKNLPFGSIPNGLINATGLIIPNSEKPYRKEYNLFIDLGT